MDRGLDLEGAIVNNSLPLHQHLDFDANFFFRLEKIQLGRPVRRHNLLHHPSTWACTNRSCDASLQLLLCKAPCPKQCIKFPWKLRHMPGNFIYRQSWYMSHSDVVATSSISKTLISFSLGPHTSKILHHSSPFSPRNGLVHPRNISEL